MYISIVIIQDRTTGGPYQRAIQLNKWSMTCCICHTLLLWFVPLLCWNLLEYSFSLFNSFTFARWGPYIYDYKWIELKFDLVMGDKTMYLLGISCDSFLMYLPTTLSRELLRSFFLLDSIVGQGMIKFTTKERERKRRGMQRGEKFLAGTSSGPYSK